MSATDTSELCIRAFEPDDLPAAGEVSAEAFGHDISDRERRRRWLARLEHTLMSDPDGAFVAERDGEIIGVAEAMVRERLWCLSLLTVRPGAQSAGAGRALMQRSLDYGETDAGLIVSSNDPRALRLYGVFGFRLLPTFQSDGAFDRRSLPAPHSQVREAGERDLEALADISRAVRGAPHTLELEFALRNGLQLLRLGDRGFTAVLDGHGVWALVARDEEAARTLLWSALALVEEVERPAVRWLTADQGWAIDVLLQAGMRLTAYGALCVRGAPGTLHPFIPSGPFA